MQFEIISNSGFQRGTYLYIASESSAKIELGNQAAITGLSDPVWAKVRVIVKNKIKMKARKNPNAI